MILTFTPRHLLLVLLCSCALLNAQNLPVPGQPGQGQSGTDPGNLNTPPARSFILPPMDARKAEQLKQLVEKAMEIQVEVLVNQASKVLWSKQESRMTVHGLGVAMRLEAENLLIVLQLTPYRKEGELVYLLVQAQIWNRSRTESKLNYQTIVKSTLVKLGEKITFYPLGKPQDPDQAVLQIGLMVKPMDPARVQDLLAALAKNKTDAVPASSDAASPLPKAENPKVPEKQ